MRPVLQRPSTGNATRILATNHLCRVNRRFSHGARAPVQSDSAHLHDDRGMLEPSGGRGGRVGSTVGQRTLRQGSAWNSKNAKYMSII
jgi:hypothetical protein